MRKYCFAIILVAFIIPGCRVNPRYFDCIIEADVVPSLPQQGSIVKIPVAHKAVETKFQGPAEVGPAYRYRAMLDGVEYSYCEYLSYYFRYDDSLKVIIPWNDSYEERKISIDVSISEDFEKIVWGEWKTVFESTQLGLNPGEPQKYSNLDNYVVTVVVDGLELQMDLFDTISSQCFKSTLFDGEIKRRADACSHEICLWSLMQDKVPLLSTSLARYDAGDVLLDQNGRLVIRSKAGTVNNQALTYIGRLSRSSAAVLNDYCDKIDERCKSIADNGNPDRVVYVSSDGYHIYISSSIRLLKRPID